MVTTGNITNQYICSTNACWSGHEVFSKNECCEIAIKGGTNMAEIKENKHKSEIENIMSRLKTAGVQSDEQEKQEIEQKFNTLVVEWKVPHAEAIRTVTQAILRKHGIDTKYWTAGGKAPQTSIDLVKADNEWLSLKAKVVQIWDNNNEMIARTGLIGDGTGVIKFTIFARNEAIIPEDFAEGDSYLFENLVSSIWQGQFSVKANKTTKITPCEDIEVSRREQTVTGVITAISSGSGLIKRCPECNRALSKGQCGEHGKVEGVYDLRVKAVFSPFGTNDQIDLVIGTVPTEALTGMSVDGARDIATEALDAAVVEDQFRRELVGRYYEITGSTLSDSGMLVERIRHVNICTQEALAEALKEAGEGGN
jgi:replication factor A1